MLHEYKLPSLGDGVTGKVTEIMVSKGDTVKVDDIVLVVGTDKVDAEMPVDVSGVVQEIAVKVGDDVNEGDLILKIKAEGAATATPEPEASTPTPEAPAPKAEKPASTPTPTVVAPIGNANDSGDFRTSPLARKLARELNVDLSRVKASDGVRISFQDVLQAGNLSQSSANGAAGATIAHKALPDFNKYGPARREPMTRINQLISENLSYTWSTTPHAWMLEKADITDMEARRQANKARVKAAGGSLTTTAILVKAVVSCLRKYPRFNATMDPQTNEIIYKDYYHIGVAVDTPRGLLVPVIRDVDKKGLTEISIELTELSIRTRDGKNKADDMEGSTFSISNVGGIGSTTVIPIVNWPNSAILGITQAQIEAVWNKEKSTFEPRLMMPMSIAFDHRIINGADASRFLVDLKNIMEDPFMGWF